jgi:hypothetical protein
MQNKYYGEGVEAAHVELEKQKRITKLPAKGSLGSRLAMNNYSASHMTGCLITYHRTLGFLLGWRLLLLLLRLLLPLLRQAGLPLQRNFPDGCLHLGKG